MSDKNEPTISTDFTEIVSNSAPKKIIKEQPKLVKKPEEDRDELREKVIAMQKDGFSTEQIAIAFGYDQDTIAWILEEQELGTPEQILQEALKTLVQLVPIAEGEYRARPTDRNSASLTSMIDSVKGLIQELYHLKDKEEVYRNLVQKVVQPLIRQVISDIMSEFKHFTSNLEETTSKEKLLEDLKRVVKSIGIKLDEGYRRSTENLATVVGISQDAKNRVLAGIALSENEKKNT